jgi:hypothetical protein
MKAQVSLCIVEFSQVWMSWHTIGTPNHIISDGGFDCSTIPHQADDR